MSNELIFKVEVKTYRQHRWCDKCKRGTMSYSGKASPDLITLFEHFCSYCGSTDNFLQIWPSTITEEVDFPAPPRTQEEE